MTYVGSERPSAGVYPKVGVSGDTLYMYGFLRTPANNLQYISTSSVSRLVLTFDLVSSTWTSVNEVVVEPTLFSCDAWTDGSKLKLSNSETSSVGSLYWLAFGGYNISTSRESSTLNLFWTTASGMILL